LLWLTNTGATQIWHVTGSQVTLVQPTFPLNNVILGL
jgi:hypothetical protein